MTVNEIIKASHQSQYRALMHGRALTLAGYKIYMNSSRLQDIKGTGAGRRDGGAVNKNAAGISSPMESYQIPFTCV